MSVGASPSDGYRIEREQGDWVELIEALDAASTDTCVYCDRELGGFLGSFTWGIVHGLGHCSECAFPYALYHYFGEGKDTIQLRAFVPIAELPQELEAR